MVVVPGQQPKPEPELEPQQEPSLPPALPARSLVAPPELKLDLPAPIPTTPTHKAKSRASEDLEAPASPLHSVCLSSPALRFPLPSASSFWDGRMKRKPRDLLQAALPWLVLEGMAEF